MEMIDDGLRRSKKLARVRPRQTAVSDYGCGIKLVSCRRPAFKSRSYGLQPLQNLLLGSWPDSVRYYCVCLQTSCHAKELHPHAKGIESRHVGSSERVSRWCISQSCALVKPRL
jgi:hypothetical protein